MAHFKKGGHMVDTDNISTYWKILKTFILGYLPQQNLYFLPEPHGLL